MPGPPEASLDHLREGQTLAAQPFRSRVPFLGPLISWFRTRWNNVSTTWYVRPLIAQQNRFNAGVVEHLAAQNTRVDRQESLAEGIEARLHDAETRLAEAVARLAERDAQVDDLRDRTRDHDAWLITRDREQSGYVRDLAEVTLQLIQLKRQLQELNRESPAGLAGQDPAEHSE
jgi:superfamily II RNA helicase